MAISTYRDLEVWREAMELVTDVYRLTRRYPREETCGLAAQTQRAAVSIAANIAEGHGRNARNEHRHHVQAARGSLAELETHLLVAQRLGYLSPADLKSTWLRAQIVGRLLNGLVRALR